VMRWRGSWRRSRRAASTGCWIEKSGCAACGKTGTQCASAAVQKVPVKVASEWDTTEVGNLQLDYVFHCGRSTAGEYVHTLSAADIATGWWEGRRSWGDPRWPRKRGWSVSGNGCRFGFGRFTRTTTAA